MALEQAESARKIATDMLTRLTLHPSRLGNQVPRFHQADRQPHGNERLGAFFAGLRTVSSRPQEWRASRRRVRVFFAAATRHPKMKVPT